MGRVLKRGIARTNSVGTEKPGRVAARIFAAPFLALLLMACAVLGVKADHQDAVALPVGTEVAGALQDKDSEDWYRIDIAGEGAFRLDFSGTSSTTGWTVSLHDSSLTELCRWDSVNKPFSSNEFSGPAGAYYVRVVAKLNTSSYLAPIQEKYSLKVSFQEGVYEKELNEDYKTATPFRAGEPITGNLRTEADVDYYKLELDKDSVVEFAFSAMSADPGNGWNFVILDGELQTIYQMEKVVRGFSTGSMGLGKGTYYVKLSAYWTLSAPVGDNYTITATVGTGYWESEDNDSREKADPVYLNRAYTGTLCEKEDADYYQFKLSGKQKLKLGFTCISEDPRYGWRVRILDSKGAEAFNAGMLKKSQNSETFTLPKGTYYVVVDAAYSNLNPPLYDPYSIKLVPYETEKNNSTAKANVLSLIKYGSGKYTACMYGKLSSKNDVDYYKFSVNGAYTGTLSLTGSAKAWKVAVYDSKGKQVAAFTQSAKTTSKSLKLVKGTYTVKIEKAAAAYSSKSYRLDLKVKSTK